VASGEKARQTDDLKRGSTWQKRYFIVRLTFSSEATIAKKVFTDGS
jgi:hypothetical protein